MSSWAERCASGWLDASLAASLVTGFAALAMIQCRQPARRRVWGRFGLLASLAIAPVAWFGPLPKLDLRHPTSTLWTAEPSTDEARSIRRAEDARATAGTRIGRDLAPQGYLMALVCGWVVGIGRLGLGIAGSRRLIRRSRKASTSAGALLEALPFASRLSGRPRLLVSDRTGRPVLVGYRRPVILIPSQLDQAGAEAQLRLGLLHELAHAEAGDHRFALIASIAQTVWFFLPQVWWLRSQLRLDAEFLADHRAVGHFGTSFGYAESLVGLALGSPSIDPSDRPAGRLPTPAARSTPPPRRAGGLASALSQRVQMLLKCPFEVEDRAPRGWAFAVAITLIGWTLASSCLSIRDERGRSGETTRDSSEKAVRAFRLAELAIAAQLPDNRPFDLRFRLPERFRLACEVLAEPAELGEIEILGYRLGPSIGSRPVESGPGRSAWRRVEILRKSGGIEVVFVDGIRIRITPQPPNRASWLTIRPVPGRTTRLRRLNLTW